MTAFWLLMVASDRKSDRRRMREFPGKRAVSAAAKSAQALKLSTVNLLWWGATIVKR
jgi:hypothetical protein